MNAGKENIDRQYPKIERRVAGIFKGGGAKGIVYAGALRELRARGIWFDTVAGSSAGALTATLIACGLDPIAIGTEAGKALELIPRNVFRGFFQWRVRSFFRTDQFEAWLEERLREAVSASINAEHITFRQLADLTESIELNVVAMDLDRKQPIVFSAHTTPNSSVARAVVASCAIPLAMPPGRVVIAGSNGALEIHRIVDGGAWANYPAFVYHDRSFRTYNNLPPFDSSRMTLGFVIIGRPEAPDETFKASDPPPLPTAPDRELTRAITNQRLPMDRGAVRSMGVAGALLSWVGVRLFVTIAIPAFAALAMLAWVVNEIRNSFPLLDGTGALQDPLALLAAFIAFTFSAATIVLAILQFRFAHEAIDVGFPSVLAALSVGPGIPDWVGTAQADQSAEADRVVRLWAPEQIGTVTFNVNPRVRESVIKCAAESAAAQLDKLFPSYKCAPNVPEYVVRPPRIIQPDSGISKFRRWLLTWGSIGLIALVCSLIWPEVRSIWLVFIGAGAWIHFINLTDREVAKPYEPDLLIAERNPVEIEWANEERKPSGFLAFICVIGLVTFVVIALALIKHGYYKLAVLAVGIMAQILWHLMRQLLLERLANQNVNLDQSFKWKIFRPLFAATLFCVIGGAIIAGVPQMKEGRLGYSALALAFTVFGIGQLLSGLARLNVYRHKKRYAAEIALRKSELGVSDRQQPVS